MMNYGDGTVIYYPISSLPVSFTHTWTTAGTKTVNASGMGNCVGSATTSVVVTAAPPPSTVSGVAASPSPVGVGQVGTVTVTGTNPCGAVMMNYGDGTVIYYPISSLPVSLTHTWTAVGTKTVSASGMGNCSGSATTSVVVF
jgi:hypothetical protein